MSTSESDRYRTSESDSIDNYSSVSDTETESDISCDPSMPIPYSFEPSASDTSSTATSGSSCSSDDDEDSSRLTDMSWYVNSEILRDLEQLSISLCFQQVPV